MSYGDSEEYLEEIKSGAKVWLCSRALAGKNEVKISDLKEQFPVIHLKWIEMCIENLAEEGVLLTPEGRSRVKLYSINQEWPELKEHKSARETAPSRRSSDKENVGNSSPMSGTSSSKKKFSEFFVRFMLSYVAVDLFSLKEVLLI